MTKALDPEAVEKAREALRADILRSLEVCDPMTRENFREWHMGSSTRACVAAYLAALPGAGEGKRCVINMRVQPDVLATIDAAAKAVGKTRTALMLESAKDEALRVLRERGPVVVPGPSEPARPSTPREMA